MKNRLPSFTIFEKKSQEGEGETESYAPPKYVVQPPVNDKGWEMFKTAFDAQKPYFKPGIKSSNHDLKEHDYE
jgi:hypothetical protein